MSSHLNPSDAFEPSSTQGLPPFTLRLEPMDDGWVRARVEGELAFGSAESLERAVEHELLSRQHVLLDLSQIDFIDSTGLRVMTSLVRTAKGYGCQLKLSSDLPPHARRLMEIVGLLPFVPIQPD